MILKCSMPSQDNQINLILGTIIQNKRVLQRFLFVFINNLVVRNQGCYVIKYVVNPHLHWYFILSVSSYWCEKIVNWVLLDYYVHTVHFEPFDLIFNNCL